MIDPTKYMPVLQCYTCYNVTTRASEREKEGSRIIIQGTREGDGAVFCSIVGMGPRFEGSSFNTFCHPERSEGSEKR